MNHSSNSIRIGNQTYNRADLLEFLSSNKEQELVDKLSQETSLNPEQIKIQIENLKQSSPIQSMEKASLDYTNNIYTFKYINDVGNIYIVGPKDAYWTRVQELLKDDLLYKKFKKEYDVYINSRNKRKRNNIIILAVIAVALLLLWAFFLGIV